MTNERRSLPGKKSPARDRQDRAATGPPLIRNALSLLWETSVKVILHRIMARSSAPRFALVASEFNREYVDGLVAAAQAGLAGHAIDLVRVPGAFEIPLQVQRLARARKYAAILALGVVWQGKTAHAAEITRAVTDALMRISLENDVPVIHQVLAIGTEAEARARCFGKKLNRGREAAEAALALTAPRSRD